MVEPGNANNNNNNIDMTDDDIDRLIEDELKLLGDDVDIDDDQDVNDPQKNFVDVEDENEEEDLLAVSIGHYLAALKLNERRAEDVLQATKDAVEQVESSRLDVNELLRKKLKEELIFDEENENTNEDLLNLRNNVMKELEEGTEEEEEDKNLERDEVKEASLEIMEEIRSLEEKTEKELKELKERHNEQKKKEEKQRKEKIVFDLLNEEKKRKNKESLEHQRKIQEAEHEKEFEILEKVFHEEEVKLESFAEQINKTLDEEMVKEKQRLFQIKDEINRNEVTRRNKSVICIQKNFRMYSVKRRYKRQLDLSKDKRKERERLEYEELLRHEESKRKEEEQQKLEEVEKKEKERQQRIDVYEENKLRAKQNYDELKRLEKSRTDNIGKNTDQMAVRFEKTEDENTNKDTEEKIWNLEKSGIEITNVKTDQTNDNFDNSGNVSSNEKAQITKKSGIKNINKNTDQIADGNEQNNDQEDNTVVKARSDDNDRFDAVDNENLSIPNIYLIDEAAGSQSEADDEVDRSKCTTTTEERNISRTLITENPTVAETNLVKPSSAVDIENLMLSDVDNSTQPNRKALRCSGDRTTKLKETDDDSLLFVTNDCPSSDTSVLVNSTKSNSRISPTKDKPTGDKLRPPSSPNPPNGGNNNDKASSSALIIEQSDPVVDGVDGADSRIIGHTNKPPVTFDADDHKDSIGEMFENNFNESSSSSEKVIHEINGINEIFHSSTSSSLVDSTNIFDMGNSVYNTIDGTPNSAHFTSHNTQIGVHSEKDDPQSVAYSGNYNTDPVVHSRDGVNQIIVRSRRTEDDKIHLPGHLLQLFNSWLDTSDQIKSLVPIKRKNRLIISASDKKTCDLSRKEILEHNESEEKDTLLLKGMKSCHGIAKHFPSLKRLTIEDSQITNGHIMDGLPNLVSFQMTSCHCSNISLKTKHLRTLDISENKIQSLRGLGELTSLAYLRASGNKISRLSGLENCFQLKYLDLSCNQIISTKGIGYLRNLVFLSLRNNDVTSLSEIDQCRYLVVLDLMENNLTELPHFGDNVVMSSLNVNNNSVQSLEKLVRSWLPLLTHFSMIYNRIEDVSCLTSFPHLVQLDLRGNFIDKFEVKTESFIQELCLVENPARFETCMVEELSHFPHSSTEQLLQKALEKNTATNFNKLCFQQSTRLLSLLCQLEESEGCNEKVDALDSLHAACVEFNQMHKNLLQLDCSDKQQLNSVPPVNSQAKTEQRIKQETDSSNSTSCLEIKAATKIQALYRGFRVRKAYFSFLAFISSPHAKHFGMGSDGINNDDNDDDVSNFDYDEEIDLNDFEVGDNNLLDDWKIPPTPQALNKNISVPPLHRGSESTSSSAVEHELREAWRTPSVQSVNRPLSTASTSSSRNTQCFTPLESQRSRMSKKDEELAIEWGFHSDRTTLLMKKRAKKLGQQTNKKKLDSQKRYELFKKMDKAVNHSAITPRKKQLHRESYFERYASPIQLDKDAKDFVYSWICNQPIVHEDHLDDFPVSHEAHDQFVSGKTEYDHNHNGDQKPRTKNSCIFPPIDSSIISGRRQVALVQSEIHNPKPPTKEKPSSGSSSSARQRRNRNSSNNNNSNDSSFNNTRNKSNSAPDPLQKTKYIDQKWTDMVYR